MIGIYPRFIEPHLIKITHYFHKDPQIKKPFSLLQLSDLHINDHTPWWFLKKLIKKVKTLSPDLIVITGDFFCCAKPSPEDKLTFLLKSLKELGKPVFSILGNHDYEKFVSITDTGLYDVIEKKKTPLIKGFQRLFKTITLQEKVGKGTKDLLPHPELLSLFKRLDIPLLHNESATVDLKGHEITIIGCGEYMCGQLDRKKAFEGTQNRALKIVLLHNPDGIKEIEEESFLMAFAGHTHGGQINLPFFREKFSLLENKKHLRGKILLEKNKSTLIVSRGLGSVFPFRWFSKPEIVFVSFKGENV